MVPNKFYVFYDGDRIGERFAATYASGDLASLALLSATMRRIHAEIEITCLKRGSHVVECGGDEGLVETPFPEIVITAIQDIWTDAGFRVSVGQASTPGGAFENCVRAKRRLVLVPKIANDFTEINS